MIFRFINRWRKSSKPWRGQRRRRTSRTNQNQRAIRRREKDFFKHPDQTFGCGFFGFWSIEVQSWWIVGYHRQIGNGKVRFGGETREAKLRCKFSTILSFQLKIAFLYRKKLTELKNRQKQQLRQKAMKKGLDPE